MKKQVSFFALMFCLLFAGQAGAQTPVFLKKQPGRVAKATLRNSSQRGEQPVFPMLSGTRVNNPAAQQAARPTTVFREYPLESWETEKRKEKYECEYDTYGHVTSVKRYDWDNSQENYVLKGSVVREYHQLPNGEFVITKEERTWVRNEEYTEKRRYTAAYDNKGMQLWYQTESSNSDSPAWQLNSRTEARLVNGIRTAILQDGEVDNSYAFDSKGRITRHDEDGIGWTSSISYTWNDNDRLVEVVSSGTEDMNGDGLPDYSYSYTYSNIQIAHNEQYFDPYSLQPFIFGSDYDVSSDDISWGNFSVDDYTLHQVYYNLDATGTEDGEEIEGQMRVTVHDGGNRIEQTATVGTEVVSTETVYVLDAYGSYRRLSEDKGEYQDQYERSATYNEYGELVRKYSFEFWIYAGEENTYGSGYLYDREYDNQKRPVKTTYSSKYGVSEDPVTRWEETYTAWTAVDLPSGIAETTQPAASVYLNPAAKNIRLSGIDGKASVALSDINGRIVLRRNIAGEETLSVAHLPAGMYFASIQTNEKISTQKFIIK